MLYLLNYSDEKNSLLDISNLMHQPIISFQNEIEQLMEKELLKKQDNV